MPTTPNPRAAEIAAIDAEIADFRAFRRRYDAAAESYRAELAGYHAARAKIDAKRERDRIFDNVAIWAVISVAAVFALVVANADAFACINAASDAGLSYAETFARCGG